ncbi:Uncharacterised protein [Shigella sonnei]|nr:Uncharacterised protein [Shigella sonnei]
MDHVRSRTLLALFAVYAQAQRCILWIAGKFRRGDKPGKRTRVIKRFSLFPRLPGFLHFSLNITQCQIKRHAVTGNGFADMLFRCLTQRRANQHRQFDFMMN